MNKKKISIITLSAVVIVLLGLGFNSIFKKANPHETDNNNTLASSSQSIEENEEIEAENTETEKDNKENEVNEEDKKDKDKEEKEDKDKQEKEDKDNKDKESEKKEDNTNSSNNSDANSSQATKPGNSETTKPSNNQTTKPNKPSNTTTPSQPKNQTVTIAISCKTAINNGVNKKPGFSYLPASGVILQTMEVEFNDGDTVFDILVRATRKKGIHMEYTGAGSNIYIEGIHNLYEFDGGPNSGWMYCVNGVYPNYGVGAYKVKSSDVIKFNYTCNLGADLGVRVN